VTCAKGREGDTRPLPRSPHLYYKENCQGMCHPERHRLPSPAFPEKADISADGEEENGGGN